MATDNTQLNSPLDPLGDIIATDALTTINGGAAIPDLKVQRVKAGFGVDGDFNDVNPANPFPVTDATLATKDFATQTTLAAVLAKLSADPATQTTLAAVLAKLTSDPATQTTLAAILAKIIAAPSTEVKQDALNTLVTTLNSIVATASKQDTGNTSLNSIDAVKLDVALSTRLKPADTLAGVTAVGSITNALPSGANAIGKLTANDGVDIGDVTINNPTFPVQENGAALTSLQLIDDTVYVDEAIFTAMVSKISAIGAVVDDIATDSAAENTIAALRMSTRRELFTQIRDAGGSEVGLRLDATGQMAGTMEDRRLKESLVLLSYQNLYAQTNATESASAGHYGFELR